MVDAAKRAKRSLSAGGDERGCAMIGKIDGLPLARLGRNLFLSCLTGFSGESKI